MTPAGAQPLEATFDRLRALSPWIDGVVWNPAHGLVAAPPIEDVLGAVGEVRATEDRRVQVLLGLHGSVFSLIAPVLGAFLVDRRVPCLGAGCTTAAWSGGDAPGRLVVCGRFAAPEGHEALRSALDDALGTGLRPLIARFAALGGVRERTLWLSAADTVAGTFLWIGDLADEEARAASEADRLLHGNGSPLASPRAAIRRYPTVGGTTTVCVRATCCLAWRLAGGTTCATCPLVDEPRRAALLFDRPAS